MKRLFRSDMTQLFRLCYRAALMLASVLVAALALLLTTTATYASPSTTNPASTSVTTSHVPCPADNICLYSGIDYTGSM